MGPSSQGSSQLSATLLNFLTLRLPLLSLLQTETTPIFTPAGHPCPAAAFLGLIPPPPRAQRPLQALISVPESGFFPQGLAYWVWPVPRPWRCWSLTHQADGDQDMGSAQPTCTSLQGQPRNAGGDGGSPTQASKSPALHLGDQLSQSTWTRGVSRHLELSVLKPRRSWVSRTSCLPCGDPTPPCPLPPIKVMVLDSSAQGALKELGWCQDILG